MSGLREQNRQVQRARILSAAFDLFADRGFDEVTVSDVAAQAGVARATVFNHFESKQGLVETITVQMLDYYRQMLEAALAERDTPTAVLSRALYDAMGAGIENARRDQRGVFCEIARLQLGFDESGPAQRMNERNQALLVKLFTRGQKRGELAPGFDPDALASAFTVLANGTITDWLFNETEPSLRERMGAAAEIFLGSVALDAAATRAIPLPDLNPTPRPGARET
jgi:AcrR family transcriptional regulator